MSVNQKMKSHLVFSENRINLANSVNFAEIKYSEAEKDNKRYSNSSNKNNLYLDKEKYEDIEKLNKIYDTKEKEYNHLYNQYKEIIECLNQKRDLLNRNKSKYQSLIINNNNMKTMLLKLMKIKEE